jgi:hypothetical protein
MLRRPTQARVRLATATEPATGAAGGASLTAVFQHRIEFTT